MGAAATALLLPAPTKSAEAKPQATEPSLTVDVVTPASATFARNIAATGTVRARDELVIGSDASGVRLLDVLVDVGSTVQRGQLLARGDDACCAPQLAQQDAQIKQAQAELAQARANLERAERVKRLRRVQRSRRCRRADTAPKPRRPSSNSRSAQRRELEVRIAQTRVVAPGATA